MPKITTYRYRGTKADGTKVFMPDPEREASEEEVKKMNRYESLTRPRTTEYTVRTVTPEEAARMFHR